MVTGLQPICMYACAQGCSANTFSLQSVLASHVYMITWLTCEHDHVCCLWMMTMLRVRMGTGVVRGHVQCI
jgi:hypothetical protein